MSRIPNEGSVTRLYLLGSVNGSISITTDLVVTVLFCSSYHGYWSKLIPTPKWHHAIRGGKRPLCNTRLGKSASSQKVKMTHGNPGYFSHLCDKTPHQSSLRKEGYNWFIMEWRAWCYSWGLGNGSFWLVHNLVDFEAELGYDFPIPSLGAYSYQLEHTSPIFHKLPEHHHHMRSKCSNGVHSNCESVKCHSSQGLQGLQESSSAQSGNICTM